MVKFNALILDSQATYSVFNVKIILLSIVLLS